jgi:hypothetical protein
MWFGIWARKLRQTHGLWAISEQRVKLGPNRYRIPDVCVTLGRPTETVLTSRPLIVVEILSPTDTLSRVAELVEDHLAFGVPHVWVVDPLRREAYECGPNGLLRVDALEVKEHHLALPLSELFAELDETPLAHTATSVAVNSRIAAPVSAGRYPMPAPAEGTGVSALPPASIAAHSAPKARATLHAR